MTEKSSNWNAFLDDLIAQNEDPNAPRLKSSWDLFLDDLLSQIERAPGPIRNQVMLCVVEFVAGNPTSQPPTDIRLSWGLDGLRITGDGDGLAEKFHSAVARFTAP